MPKELGLRLVAEMPPTLWFAKSDALQAIFLIKPYRTRASWQAGQLPMAEEMTRLNYLAPLASFYEDTWKFLCYCSPREVINRGSL
jgi:hypothetical protein